MKRGRLSDFIADQKRKARVSEPPLDTVTLAAIIASMEAVVRGGAKYNSSWS